MDEQKILSAGQIASQVRKYIKTIVKPGVPLLEIAEKIEAKIKELGGKPAFPTNLSINEIAAHYTPSHDDTSKAHGLLKVDFGVHIDGWIADTAISFDLEDSEENKKLIQASEDALKNAIELIKLRSQSTHKIKENVNPIKNSSAKNPDEVGFGATNSEQREPITLSQIGAAIQKSIESQGFSPIINLSGHSLENYELHAGTTIPNYDDKKETRLEKGSYAIEPFASNGSGKIHEGKPSNIYMLINEKNPRSQTAREVLQFIVNEYQTLPFCSRWLFKKFGAKGLFALRELEANGNIHNFEQLVETDGSKVSQAEHTILITEKETKITTE